MMNKKTDSNFSVPLLQRLFVWTYGLSLLSSLLYHVYLIAPQLSNGSNPAGFAVVFVGVTTPLACLVVGYVLHSKRERLTRLFDSMIISVVGSGLYTVISDVTIRAYQTSQINIGGARNYVLYDLTITTIVLAIISLALYLLKKNGRW